ncbi:MAG: hypothetical protein SFW67_11065 [Myxococcaceae bacterium]|nr:hypothetical protein [Myxococcaceae bacterium]
MASRRRSLAVGLDAQWGEPRFRKRISRKILTVGEFPRTLRDELLDRGATLVDAPTLNGVFDLLAAEAFDVILVNPIVEGGGLDFVNALKEGPVEHERTKATLYGARGTAAFLRGVQPPALETLVSARSRHALTPVLVTPLAGETSYAIVVQPPMASAVRSLDQLPLTTAAMTVSAAEFLGRTGALA